MDIVDISVLKSVARFAILFVETFIRTAETKNRR